MFCTHKNFPFYERFFACVKLVTTVHSLSFLVFLSTMYFCFFFFFLVILQRCIKPSHFLLFKFQPCFFFLVSFFKFHFGLWRFHRSAGFACGPLVMWCCREGRSTITWKFLFCVFLKKEVPFLNKNWFPFFGSIKSSLPYSAQIWPKIR